MIPLSYLKHIQGMTTHMFTFRSIPPSEVMHIGASSDDRRSPRSGPVAGGTPPYQPSPLNPKE